MKKYILFITVLTIISCSNCGNSNTQVPVLIKESKNAFYQMAADFITKYKATHEIFEFSDNEVVQIVAIEEIDKKTISFIIKTISKTNNRESVLDGIAILKEGDVEIDEDEQGIGYPVSEYIYNYKCWVAIRIAFQTKDKVRINTSKCNDLSSTPAPFDSKGILKKVN